MYRPPSVPTGARFALAYILVGLCGFLGVIGFAAGLRGQLPRPPSLHKSPSSTLCVSVGCAQLGQDVTYVLHGRVLSIDESQPGVRCVQVASQKSGGTYCELVPRS